MADDNLYGERRSPSGFLILLLGISLLLGAGAVAGDYVLQNKLSISESTLAQVQEQTGQLAAQQMETQRQLRATTEALGAKVGITRRQIAQRAEDIQHQQEAITAGLAQQEAQTRAQVSNVSNAVSKVNNAVSSVKSDVGGVKQDVASTKQELVHAEQQLHAAIGDLGVQSGLIAKNAEQLEYLRHLGDRNYFTFTLRKGQTQVALSTIKLQLHKADANSSRYTLYIFSDDKRLEKKNRQLDEPLQFYTGKQPMLYEIVVNQISKNQVSGYLSTPKDMPQSNIP